MSSLFVALVLLVCHVMVFITTVQAGRWYNISKEEDMEFENQLKILNKPVIKTLRTEYGDIYDCVDFYEQPAFDHPLLKDVKYEYKMHMKPIFSEKRTTYLVSNETQKRAANIKKLQCPDGTVPIRRITKEDLIREKYNSIIRPQEDDNDPNSHYAVVRQKGRYNGAGAKITLHNPKCTDQQSSASRIRIQNGPDSIEAGWRVDPALYGDAQTRLFIRLDAGQAHCFNTRCPGFVISSTEIPLDNVYTKMSEPMGKIEHLGVFLNRDPVNGNWWLQVEIMFQLKNIGFWPARIFTGLSDWATTVEWGGEVHSPPGTIKPPMGTGEKIVKFWAVDAIFWDLALLDGPSTLDPGNLETYADTKNYEVVDIGYVDDTYKHVIVYGGQASN